MSTNWKPHKWHDCREDGHVLGSTAGGCRVCDGGLSGCSVCAQWEGEIAHQHLCPGDVPNMRKHGDDGEVVAAMHKLLRYHHQVAPIFRAATPADLESPRWIVVWDFGAWQYPGWCTGIKCPVTGKYVVVIYGNAHSVALEDIDEQGEKFPLLAIYNPYTASASA